MRKHSHRIPDIINLSTRIFPLDGEEGDVAIVDENGDIVWDDTLQNASIPNGFLDRDASEISFTDGTRTFEISVEGSHSDFQFVSGGVKYTKDTTQSVIISDTSGLHYIYFDTDGILQSTTTWNTNALIVEAVLVSIVLWDSTTSDGLLVCDERHGLMDPYTHSYLHEVFSAQWVSGLALGNMVVDGTGNLDSHAQLSVGSGEIRDEDILHTIADGIYQDISPIAEIPMFYRDGAGGTWKKETATQFPCIKATSRLYWNENISGTWQLTEIASNNDFVLTHLFATNSPFEPIIGFVGQTEYTTRGSAEQGANEELNNILFGDLATLIPELVPIATIIFQTSTSKTNTVAASISSTDDGSDYVDWRVTGVTGGGSAAGTILDVDAGTNISVDKTDPTVPIVSTTDNVAFSEVQFTGGTGDQGKVTWNSDEDTLDLIQNGTVLQIGQELHTHILNQSGSTIPDGTVVMYDGTVGASGKLVVVPMSTDPADIIYLVGVTTEEILNGGSGKATTLGKIRGLDTSSWSDGDLLYLSNTTPGTMTNVVPTSGMNVPIAVVADSHAVNGTILVRVLPIDDFRKVGTTGNETVAGIKTFSSFPITPSSAPTTDYQVANKKYVDDLFEVTELFDGWTTPATDQDIIDWSGLGAGNNYDDFDYIEVIYLADGLAAAISNLFTHWINTAYINTTYPRHQIPGVHNSGATAFIRPSLEFDTTSKTDLTVYGGQSTGDNVRIRLLNGIRI